MNDEKQIEDLAKYMHALDDMNVLTRSEERRVGKEGRVWMSA